MRHASFPALLAGLLLAAGCASNPPDRNPPAPQMRGCVVDTPGYPPCEFAPQLYSNPYYYPYPAFGPYPWYPGGVILVPYPVPVPTPLPPKPPKPPKPKPPKPVPPHARHMPVPCRPTRDHPCP